jgi:integrase
LRDIDAYHGSFVVRQALKLLSHTFLRPGELRQAKWEELDLEKAIWNIPAQRMKKKREHIVPLSSQSLAILSEIYPLTGNGQYIFVTTGHKKPITDNTLLTGLRRIGYSKEEMVAHSFRHIASTNLHELGFDSHIIEAQMAHVDNSVKGVYNKAQYLPARKAMMQAWSDYLDKLKKSC